MAQFWDDVTRRELGWPEVWALFRPVSKVGRQWKKQVRPYLPGEQAAWQEAMDDLQAVSAALQDDEWSRKANDALAALPDAAAVLTLIEQGAAVRQVDLFELKSFLWQGLAAAELLAAKGLRLAWWVTLDWERLLRRMNPPGDLVPTFSLADAEDEELARLRAVLMRVDGQLLAEKKAQQERLRTRYGRGPGRDGTLLVEKSERAMRELAESDGELSLVQENRFEAVFRVVESAEMAALREEKEAAVTAMEDRETQVLSRLAEEFRADVPELLEALQALARLDWTLAKAVVARQWGDARLAAGAREGVVYAPAVPAVAPAVQGAFPVWVEDPEAPWRVEGAWHPIARASVEARGGAFTPLDVELRPGVGVITGPNMGGKTVVLKTLGLLQALAQHGLPVPAAIFQFQPVARIGLSGGDEQSLTSGLSSFGAEMQRIADLLAAPGRALLLLDEVARTTNPQEGEALAVALASHLLETGHAALIASHFPKVTDVEGVQRFRVAGLRHDVLEELERAGRADDVLSRLQSAMDYRLLPSADGNVPRDAVRLARCFGLPERVVEKTVAVLEGKEGF